MIILYNNSASLFEAWDTWDEKGSENTEYPAVVASCGFQKFITKDQLVDRPAGRADYNIIYITKGKGYFTTQGQTIVACPGDVFLYLPGVPQHYIFKGEDSTELYWMHISGYAIGEQLDKLGLSQNPFYHVGIDPTIIGLYKKIIREMQLKDPGYDQLSSGLLTVLLSLYARKTVYAKSNSSVLIDSDVREAINMMHYKYNEEYSAEYYADLCNLSLSRFIHKFKDATGMSPLEYIIRIRIDEAKRLLHSTSYNVSEISVIVGYENPLYFSRVFKKETGVSPVVYRKSKAGQGSAYDDST